MEWTDSQREAIETRGRRVLVSAGAGSGKTRVLVERYLRLLEEHPTWRVSDIVAVTFTEKAAREMVSRIRREIRTRIAQSDSPAVRERWRTHRNAIDSARIGTIHALCASILRAHPAEAGIDPAFEVSEEIEAAHLLEQAIEGVIAEAAINRPTTDDRQPTVDDQLLTTDHRSPTTDHRPPITDRAARSASCAIRPLNLLEIFTYLSPKDTQSALTALIAQGDRARAAMTRLTGKSVDDIFMLWQTTLDHLRSDAARALLERDAWLCAAQTVRRTAALDATDKIEQCRVQVAGWLAEIDSSLTVSAGDQVTRALLDLAAGVNLVGGSKKKWPSEDALKTIKEALRQLREAVRDEELLALELNEADRAAAEVTARLVRLYERARHRFAWLKQQRSMLDFNDLEEITERMLARHPEVCARYTDPERGLIRALMVDEFQDTAPIQKRILWMLAPRTDEMFIIGDAKQSIYRFRGADVTVFHDVRDDLKQSGGHDVPMDVCFRTHTRLINFINHLFPAVFTRESRYDTPYEAMSARRQSPHSSPSVELHIITQSKDAENKLNTAVLREIEAAFIAHRIREIKESRELIVSDKDGHARAADWGDFALLFQASTSFEIYEQALAGAEIPYVTIAGRGFYDRQEITDITNLLAFLVSANDSLRLAAVLRSPMFALSDETLLSLRISPDRGPLWKSLFDDTIKHAEQERAALEFARATLKKLQALVGRVSAAEVMVAALRETGYLATLMALPHGERRVANIEKFIEQARARAQYTLAQLVERADDLKFREAREGEATIEEAGAVRLMTVHKSKGLEFPIVWIADANYTARGGRDLVTAHPDYGIAIRLGADHLDTDNERLQAASFAMLQRIEAQMDGAEKKRLLYVAATRARDHLMISAAPGRARLTSATWLGRILRALGIDENDQPDTLDYPGGEVTIGWHDAEELLASEQRASRDSSRRQQPSSQPAPAATNKKALDRFPLIRPLAPR